MTNLLIPKTEAEEKLNTQIKQGNDILSIQINNEEELESTQLEYRKWSSFNAELIKKIFDTRELFDEYNHYYGSIIVPTNELAPRIKRFHKNVKDKIGKLEIIQEKLPLIDELKVVSIKENNSKIISQNKIFIVHGHNTTVKESVARFLEKNGIKTIILHEQPNKGRTIIEKFEDYSDVGYSIICLTSDDKGCGISETKTKPRARQNVIFELGYFIGKLGREKVCALYCGNIELPTDFLGVLYILFDENGNWKSELVKELKEAGFKIDSNNL